MRRPQVTQLPQDWRQGRALSAANLQQNTAAIKQLASQLNAGGQAGKRLATSGVSGLTVAVSSLPAVFDDTAPSFLNVVRHPSLIGSTPDEFLVAGWFDTFPASYDIYDYTYTDINTRNSDDNAGSIITEELTPRVIIGMTALVLTVDVDNEEPPLSGEYITNTIDLWWQPGQWWASETLLGAGLGP